MTNTPVIPGYHPDPSICRVGADYFLATSSFEYSPGVPLFTSTDLRSWHQLGNVLDRESQLTVRTGVDGASGGVYAPTLRHHDGRFWLTTTNVDEITRGHLIVHAESPEGPWSEPVHTEGLIGIDPDLAWGDDGVCRLTWGDVMRGCISQVEVDPSTGQVLSEPVVLWRGIGTGDTHPEGPHVFKRGDWWYLLVAEGGTGPGHMVTVARSASIDGPFAGNPANPILSHRSTTNAVQSTGHADLVEAEDGSWAMVHLGVRLRGSFPRWHTNGRETFLVGIDWVDDWPVVVEDRFPEPTPETSFVDTFDAPTLHPRWIAPGVAPASFARIRDGRLHLTAGRAPASRDAEHLLAARARDEQWAVEVVAPEGDIALGVRIDDAHQAVVQRVGDRVTVRVVIGPLDQVIAERTGVDRRQPLTVHAVANPQQRPGARTGPDRIVLGVGSEPDVLADIDGRYCSTEVAGGFTGRVIGVEALGGDATVTRFSYSALH